MCVASKYKLTVTINNGLKFSEKFSHINTTTAVTVCVFEKKPTRHANGQHTVQVSSSTTWAILVH